MDDRAARAASMSTIRIPPKVLDGEELLPFAGLDDNRITASQQLSVAMKIPRAGSKFAGKHARNQKFGCPYFEIGHFSANLAAGAQRGGDPAAKIGRYSKISILCVYSESSTESNDPLEVVVITSRYGCTYNYMRLQQINTFGMRYHTAYAPGPRLLTGRRRP